MRTTLTLDDRIATALKKKAYDTGQSFKDVVNQTLRTGLQVDQVLPKPRPIKCKTYSLGGPRPGINLDKALQLAGELEDEEIVRKMQLRSGQ